MYSHALRPRGFTLIELLITLAILAILATLSVPVAQTIRQRAKEQELRRALWEIRHAIDAYKSKVDEGHIRIEKGSSGYPKDLTLLVEGVPDQQDPKHPKLYFLRRIPRDPMNAEGAVNDSETWGKRSYASDADDPHEGADVFDIYSRSEMTGLNGVPYAKW